MARHKQQATELEAAATEELAASSTSQNGEDGRANGEEDERSEVAYTDKKGAAWKRLMAQRYPKAVKALERLITLGTWTNYHYTQEEAARVCDKLSDVIARIKRAHQRDATPEESPLALPWED